MKKLFTAGSQFSPQRNNHLYLYTKGNEFSLNGNNYIGEYHFESQLPFTEAVPSKTAQPLYRSYGNVDHYTYDRLFNFQVKPLYYTDPKPHVYSPTDQAYKVGVDTRYFVQRVINVNSYPIEIDQTQFENIGKVSGIDPGIYSIVKIRWMLVGSKQTLLESNGAAIQAAQKKIPSIQYVIKGALEKTKITLS